MMCNKPVKIWFIDNAPAEGSQLSYQGFVLGEVIESTGSLAIVKDTSAKLVPFLFLDMRMESRVMDVDDQMFIATSWELACGKHCECIKTIGDQLPD